jgi:Protein of unknown function, DUF547
MRCDGTSVMLDFLAPIVHRLIHWRYGIAPEAVLNGDPQPGAPPADVAAELKQAVNAMKAEAINPDSGRVDYSTLRQSQAYAEYRRCAARLQAFELRRLTIREERLAFWINLYNALIVDAVIRFGVKNSVQDVPGFFWRAAYCVGGERFSAFDIEYGVLRANARHPVMPGPQFGPNDPRCQHSLSRLDPRVHFALVCAARSCPPIAVYDAENIDLQLEMAAKAFVNSGGAEVDVERNEVSLSRIFQWYAPDFGGPPLGWGDMRPVLRCLAQWVADEPARQRLIRGDLNVRYARYDWALN